MKCPVCEEEADFVEQANMVICTHCRCVLLGFPISTRKITSEEADAHLERLDEQKRNSEHYDLTKHPTYDERQEAATMIAWLIYSLNEEESGGNHTWKLRFRGEDWRSHVALYGVLPVTAYETETNRPIAQWVRHEVKI